jgi:ubiquinone/menaquinone biosynthesis C-methylase UbiE
MSELQSWGHYKTQQYLETSRKHYWNYEQLLTVMKNFPLKEIQRALDIGTGLGFFASFVNAILADESSQIKSQVIGIDIDHNLVENARVNSSDLSEESPVFANASVYELPFPNESFDFITCQLVLLHLDEVSAALEEVSRCLKVGGHALFIEPNNTAAAMLDDSAKRLLSLEEQMQLIKLELFYNRGKTIAGRGDSNIGDLLSGFLRDSGLMVLDVKMGDRVNIISPPYDEMQLEVLDFLYGEDSYNQWQNLFLEYCLAAGMNKAEFDLCWRTVEKFQAILKKQIKNQTFQGMHAKIDYLYSCKKVE